jgi:hypothetical protein
MKAFPPKIDTFNTLQTKQKPICSWITKKIYFDEAILCPTKDLIPIIVVATTL